MATASTTGTQPDAAGSELVDPRAPRFGQSLTALGLLAGLALREPVLVAAVAVVLNAALLSGWRYDLYAFLWRRVLLPVVGRPEEREPAAPHRFAKLVGAAFTGGATLCLLADAVVAAPTVALGLSAPGVAGYALAALVAALAAFAAVTDICIGCRMYRQVSFLRRLGVV